MTRYQRRRGSATRPGFRLVLVLLTLCPVQVAAEEAATPEAVVRAYADAANRNDLEGFLKLYAPDIRKYRFPGELSGQGIAHYREIYTKAFATAPDIKVEIVELITLGDKVMVRDRVTGRPDGKTADELTIYRVDKGLIAEILYVERLVR